MFTLCSQFTDGSTLSSLSGNCWAKSACPIHVVPGEHAMVNGNDPRPFITRLAPQGLGNGWYSFDTNGVHFVALVNVVQLGAKGMGALGADQLAWLQADLAGLSASTPIVVLSHFPLWALYQDWGWGSVTALNGHIHQVQQRVEGHMRFHAGRSTAYPQPAPGVGAGPLAIVLIGGTLVGTAITVFFLPALFAIWFKVRLTHGEEPTAGS